MVTWAQTAVCKAVSPMSGSPIFDTRKKNRKTERGEFITPPRPTGRRSNKAKTKFVTYMYLKDNRLICITLFPDLK